MGVTNFNEISATGAVPALKDNDAVLLEGAAIMIYLLEKQTTPMFSSNPIERAQAIEDIMFANATMHPAYSKLFFISSLDIDDTAKKIALNAAADSINSLWNIVEQRLQEPRCPDLLGSGKSLHYCTVGEIGLPTILRTGFNRLALPNQLSVTASGDSEKYSPISIIMSAA